MPIEEIKVTPFETVIARKEKWCIVGGLKANPQSISKKCRNFKKCKKKVFVSYESIEMVKKGATVICPLCFLDLQKKKKIKMEVLQETVERLDKKFFRGRAS